MLMNVLKRCYLVSPMQFVRILKEALHVHVLKDMMVMAKQHLVQIQICLNASVGHLPVFNFSSVLTGVGTKLLIILVPVINGTGLILLGVVVAILVYLKCRSSPTVTPHAQRFTT